MTCQRLFFIFLLFSLFMAARVDAQASLGGYLKFYHHNKLVAPQEIYKTGMRLQLNISKNFGDRGTLFSSFDFDANDKLFSETGFSKRGAELEVYPVEAYLDLFFPFLDIRLGKQFIFWGKTVWINPTDNINPWDYQNISSEIEDYRLPVTALKTNWYLGPVTLEADWIPIFVPHRIPFQTGLLQTSDNVMHSSAVFMEEPALPEPTLKNSQAAFRIMHSVYGVDYSFSYYSGFGHQPDFISRRMSPDLLNLLPSYHRIHIWGSAFERVFGRLSLRGESAYFRTADPRGTNPEIANPHVQYVVSSDFSVSDQLSLNFQWIQDIQRKFNQALEKRAAAHNPVEQNIPHKVNSSVSGVVRWAPFNFVTSQLTGVVNLRDNDSFLLGFVNYEIADAIQLTLGGLFFSGPPASPFGKMNKQDKIFLELKFSY